MTTKRIDENEGHKHQSAFVGLSKNHVLFEYFSICISNKTFTTRRLNENIKKLDQELIQFNQSQVVITSIRQNSCKHELKTEKWPNLNIHSYLDDWDDTTIEYPKYFIIYRVNHLLTLISRMEFHKSYFRKEMSIIPNCEIWTYIFSQRMLSK